MLESLSIERRVTSSFIKTVKNILDAMAKTNSSLTFSKIGTELIRLAQLYINTSSLRHGLSSFNMLCSLKVLP